MYYLSRAVVSIFDLITLLLIISVLLTWVPNIKWYQEPFRTLKSFSDIFFVPCKKIIPPIGMIDISAILAFVFLAILERIILYILGIFGL